MNLPNRLTILRVCLIPFFVVFMLTDFAGGASKYIACAIFVLASLTDALDGHIARKYHLITNFGKFMDPLADKLLVCAALICMIEPGAHYQIPAWMVLVIISREFIISGFRLVASDSGVVIAASYWGKAKTVVQMVMIVVCILNVGASWYQILCVALIWASLILTVVSLLDYIVKNIKVLQEGSR
ncbi:MAG: CDP-diacylglycerol--glycerol-3-phosphate 3-phosphatidyltransferase [Lachnospiraceae bacterium]